METEVEDLDPTRGVSAVVSVKGATLSVSMKHCDRNLRRAALLRALGAMNDDAVFPQFWEAIVIGDRASDETVLSFSFPRRGDAMDARRVADEHVARWLP